MNGQIKTGHCLIILTCLWLLASCTAVKPTTLLNASLVKGHYQKMSAAYGSHGRQYMDIYRPNSSTDKPLVVFVYGGAWKRGQRRDYEFVGHALTQAGYPVMIADYRLYPEVRFPDFLYDVASAIAKVEQNAMQYLGRRWSGYVLMGHSSGAHSAALLVSDPIYRQGVGVMSQPLALMGLAGPYDLPLEDEEVAGVFAGASATQAKAVLQARRGAPANLLLHGLDDQRVLPEHSRRMASALRSAGKEVVFKLYPQVGHINIISSLAVPLRGQSPAYQEIITFLKRIDTAQ